MALCSFWVLTCFLEGGVMPINCSWWGGRASMGKVGVMGWKAGLWSEVPLRQEATSLSFCVEHLSPDLGVWIPSYSEWGLAEGGRELSYCDQGFLDQCRATEGKRKTAGERGWEWGERERGKKETERQRTAVLIRSADLSPISKKCSGFHKTLKNHVFKYAFMFTSWEV